MHQMCVFLWKKSRFLKILYASTHIIWKVEKYNWLLKLFLLKLLIQTFCCLCKFIQFTSFAVQAVHKDWKTLPSYGNICAMNFEFNPFLHDSINNNE